MGRAARERGAQSLILVLAFALAGCGNSTPSSAQQAKQLAGALTGDTNGVAADNPFCRLFTSAEIATYGGTPVRAGSNAAMGTGCQWAGTGGDGYAGTVQLQVVRSADHVVPLGAAGIRKLPDVGTKGYAVPQMGGWQAAAIQGDKSINVIVAADGEAGEAKTVAFLREALKRVGGK